MEFGLLFVDVVILIENIYKVSSNFSLYLLVRIESRKVRYLNLKFIGKV